MQWVESNGGPLILVPERHLRAWHGADGPSAAETDYERACAIEDYAAAIPVGGGAGIILAEEPLPTAWQPAPEGGGLLVRWVAAPSERAVADALAALPSGIPWEEVFDLEIEPEDGSLVLFDAALPGSELPPDHLRVALAPGHYTFELSAYRASGELELLLHRLRPIDA